jgi:branched-chain amino acid transport system substrate-binding protein
MQMKKMVVALFLAYFFVSGIMGNVALGQNSITVGAVQTTRGPLGAFGPEISAGLNDALMIANNEGGINGKRLTYVMADGSYNAQEDMILFEKIFLEHHPPVMFGNSTELSKLLAPQIANRFKVLYTGATYSSELVFGAVNSSMFIPGPTYGDQMGILLKYIAKEKPRARVAFFYSDSDFGRDSIKFGKLMCERLRLNLVSEQTADIKGADVTSQVEALNKANPDYVILHGFLVAPVPEVIKKSRELGMKCIFMGTFWGATEMLLEKLGPLAENYLAVNPYSYWWMEDQPTIKKIRTYTASNYPNVKSRPLFYMQGFFSGLVFVETLRRADKSGKINYDGLVEALQSIKDIDTGGLTAPLTIKNNRFPIARVWKANVEKQIFEPESEWIRFYLD